VTNGRSLARDLGPGDEGGVLKAPAPQGGEAERRSHSPRGYRVSIQ
jgi:hypothetical protein